MFKKVKYNSRTKSKSGNKISRLEKQAKLNIDKVCLSLNFLSSDIAIKQR